MSQEEQRDLNAILHKRAEKGPAPAFIRSIRAMRDVSASSALPPEQEHLAGFFYYYFSLSEITEDDGHYNG